MLLARFRVLIFQANNPTKVHHHKSRSDRNRLKRIKRAQYNVVDEKREMRKAQVMQQIKDGGSKQQRGRGANNEKSEEEHRLPADRSGSVPHTALDYFKKNKS